MKICITSLEEDINSPIDPRFGRARYFIILDEKGNIQKVITNAGSESQRGAGVLAAQTIVSEKVDVIISGGVGPNSFNLLGASGIKMFSAVNGSVEDNFQAWKDGQLKEISSAVSPGYGGGMGFGRGKGGFGRGRGRGQNFNSF